LAILQEVNSSGRGKWGYKITEITNGKYGGRSKQDVLNNIGSQCCR